MPIHDWARVSAGTFHTFHQHWITFLCSALNRGPLPPGYFAVSERDAQGPMPDVLALRLPENDPPAGPVGLAVKDAPPRTRVATRAENVSLYARRADRVAVYLDGGALVAVIEIVSPGNKDGTHALRTFINKADKLIRGGVHFLFVDLFPPSRRHPRGLHKPIWDRFREEEFQLPPDKPLTLASYDADASPAAYVENVAVGDILPDMPLFLEPGRYVPCPLEASYQTTWYDLPHPVRRRVEAPPA